MFSTWVKNTSVFVLQLIVGYILYTLFGSVWQAGLLVAFITLTAIESAVPFHSDFGAIVITAGLAAIAVSAATTAAKLMSTLQIDMVRFGDVFVIGALWAATLTLIVIIAVVTLVATVNAKNADAEEPIEWLFFVRLPAGIGTVFGGTLITTQFFRRWFPI